jgi:hypothetical protein
VLVLGVGLGALGCGESDLVGDYCRYGAVSRAQLDGCVSHVSEDDVRSRQTHASQYAFGDLNQCLLDAGPFCKGR